MFSSVWKILKKPCQKSETVAGQHFVECDNCETDSAQYFCKSCTGNLCENCKKTHETKRLTQDHVVVLLSKYKSDPFVCQNSKKGKCPCKVKESLKHEREKIESHWVPFLEKMQEEEESKKKLLSDKVSDVKTEIEEHFDQIIVKITSRKEETIRNFEEEKQNATNAIDKTILEIKENTRKFEDRKDEIRNILAREDEDLQNSMCMKIKEEKLTPNRMSYEVEDFCPGSLENNIVQQIFGKPPAIHETVQHNWFVNWMFSKLEKIEIKSPI
uniref:B box-type domain-containing protein n=1 Tax=Magallana gigas TaxID=29159 RepID=A0A8W8NYH7_MAGGI